MQYPLLMLRFEEKFFAYLQKQHERTHGRVLQAGPLDPVRQQRRCMLTRRRSASLTGVQFWSHNRHSAGERCNPLSLQPGLLEEITASRSERCANRTTLAPASLMLCVGLQLTEDRFDGDDFHR
jgi:hypothetical protein